MPCYRIKTMIGPKPAIHNGTGKILKNVGINRPVPVYLNFGQLKSVLGASMGNPLGETAWRVANERDLFGEGSSARVAQLPNGLENSLPRGLTDRTLVVDYV